jgi:hypothetical protein
MRCFFCILLAFPSLGFFLPLESSCSRVWELFGPLLKINTSALQYESPINPKLTSKPIPTPIPVSTFFVWTACRYCFASTTFA